MVTRLAARIFKIILFKDTTSKHSEKNLGRNIPLLGVFLSAPLCALNDSFTYSKINKLYLQQNPMFAQCSPFPLC